MEHEQTPVHTAPNSMDFLRKVYGHLLLAIIAFVGVEYYLFTSGLAATIAEKLLAVNWLLVLGGFIGLGMVARHFARSQQSLPIQYLSLFVYVVLEAIIFVPLLYIAAFYSSPTVIPYAAITTIAGFLLLTGIVFFTKKDFSFLRMLVVWGGLLAMVAIVVAVIFGMNLGLWFSVGMVGLAGVAILYDTSNIRLHYREGQHVGAAVDLFSSVATMFYYVLRIFISRD